MRLIATMGASGIKHEHSYWINEKEYKSKLSFLALAKAFKIEDIIVIGTEKSKESIQKILDKNSNIKMVTIESSEIEDVFKKSLEYFTKDTILDLTQGYRHYPMLTLLASVFLQNNKDKSIKNIYYAQILDETCHPGAGSCNYNFVSLYKYLDISNMTRIINTFRHTLLTLDYEIHDEEFTELKSFIKKLTKSIFSNDFDKSKKIAKETIYLIDEILKNNSLDVIESHLKGLQKELNDIWNLTADKESKTLLNVSEYFLSKDILLHSVTMLFESMLSFLDENVDNPACNEKELKSGKIVSTNIWERRNCLKKRIGKCRYYKYRNIPECLKFKDILFEIDRLRNIAAHAHRTGSYKEDLRLELSETIEFLQKIYKDTNAQR